MSKSRSIGIVGVVALAGAAFADVQVKESRPGVVRLSHPSHYAGCHWSQKPHEHGDGGEVARGGFVAPSTTLIDNGPSANRIDLVIVGDGYSVADTATYVEHAQRGVDDLFSTVPFDVYGELFNVHRIGVISNDSGVDNDPTQGISRDTAMDMGFYCGGTERALCVSTSKAIAFAQNAPDWDQIFAVANSTKYGGVGYPSLDVGTYSGGNASAPQVAIHELGHAMGNLADEYTYDGPTVYNGGEPAARNVSIYEATPMVAQERKWYRWIGETAPGFDGLVGTFEGGNYSEEGIYRPSNNSMMRNLGRPFNQPSIEGMIIEMWKIVAPIDTHTSVSAPLSRNQVVTVTPAASFLSVVWTLNGAFVGSGTQVNLASLSLPAGESMLRVVVSDETLLVRDEAAREAFMTETREWTVRSIPADLSGDGMVNGVDLAILLAGWGSASADITGDGTTGAGDLAVLLSAWGS